MTPTLQQHDPKHQSSIDLLRLVLGLQFFDPAVCKKAAAGDAIFGFHGLVQTTWRGVEPLRDGGVWVVNRSVCAGMGIEGCESVANWWDVDAMIIMVKRNEMVPVDDGL
jgi:hypothetical protein